MILDAWGWCNGTTQRDGTGREEGGGFRMGNTGIPVADSFQYLAKLIQYCKIKKKKNTFESILMRWMKLEPIIQSKVSQKEKHQYSIQMHIYEI